MANFMPPETGTHLGNYIFGHLLDIFIEGCIGQNKGDLSINQNKIKFKIKGSLFKKCKLKYLKPQFAGLFGQIAGSANQPNLY